MGDLKGLLAALVLPPVAQSDLSLADLQPAL